jgi:hypothetical protein
VTVVTNDEIPYGDGGSGRVAPILQKRLHFSASTITPVSYRSMLV